MRTASKSESDIPLALWSVVLALFNSPSRKLAKELPQVDSLEESGWLVHLIIEGEASGSGGLVSCIVVVAPVVEAEFHGVPPARPGKALD